MPEPISVRMMMAGDMDEAPAPQQRDDVVEGGGGDDGIGGEAVVADAGQRGGRRITAPRPSDPLRMP